MENRAEQLLEAYFAHTLTKAEAEELKSLLQDNATLAAELRFRQQIALAVKDKSLRIGIENEDWARATLPPDIGGSAILKSRWSRYLYAAAALVAVLVVAWLFLPDNDPGNFITKNTAFYPNRMTFKSLGGKAQTVPPEVVQAFRLYDQQHYAEASSALEAVAHTFPDVVDYRFYWSVSLVQTGRYAQAKEVLQPLTQGDNDYKTVCWYYLGLAYAGNGETENARAALQRYLDAPDGITYREQAMNVLKVL